jgi:hypothetical protein
VNTKWDRGHLKFPKLQVREAESVSDTCKVPTRWCDLERSQARGLMFKSMKYLTRVYATNAAANAIWSGWMLFILPPPKRLKDGVGEPRWPLDAFATGRVRIFFGNAASGARNCGGFFPPRSWIPIYCVCFTETGFSASVNLGSKVLGDSPTFAIQNSLWCRMTAWAVLSVRSQGLGQRIENSVNFGERAIPVWRMMWPTKMKELRTTDMP